MSAAHDIEVRLGMSSAPVLEAFRTDRGRVSMIMGPLGSGKTYAAIARLLKHMAEQAPNAEGVRPTRFIAIRNTYPDLTSTTIKDFQEVFQKFPIPLKDGFNNGTCFTCKVHF